MNKSIFILIGVVLLTLNDVSAQGVRGEKDFEAGFEGMLGFTFNNRTAAITLGGPNLKYWFKEDFAIGIGAWPSLIYTSNLIDMEGMRRSAFEPKLGLSPRVDFKNIVVIAPVYHFSNPDQWLWTLGIGYKFH